MAQYRLSYPASIYATIVADDVAAAKQKLSDVLKAVSNGIIIDLDIEQDADPGEMLFPDSDESGAVSPALVEIEDIEEVY